MQELRDWQGILKNHETELSELNKPVDVTGLTVYEVDQRINRKIELEQLIQEDKEIINDIKKELNLWAYLKH